MTWWHHLSALGGLYVTVPLAAAIAAWLVAARCWRLALAWCLLFGAAILLAAASQVAFLGWGIGLRALDFTGFSGHAARAAAVFPVALFLLLERRGRRRAARRRQDRPLGPDRRRGWPRAAACAGAVLAAAVALARVKVGAHAASEAAAGWVLGLACAALFMARMHATRDHAPRPLLLGLLAATLLLPRADPAYSHQWLSVAALGLSGSDRVWLRAGWQPAAQPYVPPCAPARRRFALLCT